MKQLDPISERPESITCQRQGLDISIDPTEATPRSAFEQ